MTASLRELSIYTATRDFVVHCVVLVLVGRASTGRVVEHADLCITANSMNESSHVCVGWKLIRLTQGSRLDGVGEQFPHRPPGVVQSLTRCGCRKSHGVCRSFPHSLRWSAAVYSVCPSETLQVAILAGTKTGLQSVHRRIPDPGC
jgi:hypothetical protein